MPVDLSKSRWCVSVCVGGGGFTFAIESKMSWASHGNQWLVWECLGYVPVFFLFLASPSCTPIMYSRFQENFLKSLHLSPNSRSSSKEEDIKSFFLSLPPIFFPCYFQLQHRLPLPSLYYPTSMQPYYAVTSIAPRLPVCFLPLMLVKLINSILRKVLISSPSPPYGYLIRSLYFLDQMIQVMHAWFTLLFFKGASRGQGRQ